MRFQLPDKRRVFATLLDSLERDLEAATRAHQATQTGATHEESRPENDKDTRALESSYLARGQAGRVQELREALAVLRGLPLRPFDADASIALTALVTVERDGEPRYFLVVPAGGGARLSVDGYTIDAVTVVSPMGRALLGKRLDDEFELRTPQGHAECSVKCVA